MKFKLWLEGNEDLKIIDSSKLTSEDQYLLGHAAVVENGFLVGYHVTDNPEEMVKIIKNAKKLTATYKKGRSS